MIQECWARLRAILDGREHVAEDLNAEMNAHLEFEVDARIADGIPEPAARVAAARAFGNRTLIEESAREAWTFQPVETSFIVIGAFATGLCFRTKTFAPLIFGSLFGATPWLFLALLRSIVPFVVLAPLAIAALALGYRKGGSSFWRNQLRCTGPGSGDDGGWEVGSTSSGSGSSGSDGSSSSSSSFGGGSSGGGGASGRW